MSAQTVFKVGEWCSDTVHTMTNSKYNNRTEAERSEKLKNDIQKILSKELHAQTKTTSDIWETMQN